MLVGLISDTHGKLRPAVLELFRDVELILHAGDIGSHDVLTALQAVAPVHAVLGNTDGWELSSTVPELVRLEIEQRRITVVHGHQVGAPTPRLLRTAHPDADIIVYGHTHRPLIDHAGASLVVNPGAAGPARFDLKPSVALLTLHAHAEPHVELKPITD